MIDLNKYIVTNDPGQALHTNGYAAVANGGRIGSVGGSSFNDRLRIERTRQAVGSYNRSIIGATYGVQRAKSVTAGYTSRRSADSGSIPSQSINIPSPSFSEPPARPYNPYG